MNKLKLAAIVAIVSVTAFSLIGHGQQAPQPPNDREGAGPGGPAGISVMVPPPLTRLEALAAQRTVIVVKGYTDIGTLVADDQSSVLVSAVQFSDGQNKESGVAIHVSQPIEGRTMQTTAYVDEQELDGLIAAINSLAKLQDGATPLQQFDARYQTLGAFELVSTTVNGGRMILVRAMELHPGAEQPLLAQAQFFVSRMPELAQRLTAAKELLEKLKAPSPTQ
jgi:hypothetical protein